MKILEKWHQIVQLRDMSLLDELLADEVVFYSPVLWSPQEGKLLTMMYLSAAAEIIGGENFKYVKEIVTEHQACLEFSAKVGDIFINGVDIISTNEAGKIIEFKVMVRPLKGMMILKERMFELLQKQNYGG